MDHCAGVVFFPNIGPPIIRNAGQEANDVDADDDFSSTCRVRNHVIFERVADRDVPVDR